MRLVFAGSPATALPSLRRLLDSHHEVVAVVSRPDARKGRGRHTEPSEVAALARERGIVTLTPAKVSDSQFLIQLADLGVDCCAVVAYGALLPRAALEIPRLGWVNLHFSLLPAWRGAAPVQYALWRGDEVTGATTFLIEEELDSGPVFGTVTEEIRPRDTTGELLGRLAESGAALLAATLDGIEDGSLTAVPQAGEDVSYAPRITVDDARVDWSRPDYAVDRQVRAMTPSPGAWTQWRGSRVHCGPVQLVPSSTEVPNLGPGGVRAERRRVLVGTGTRPVVLGTVTPQGKKAMPAADWARGARPGPGERLE